MSEPPHVQNLRRAARRKSELTEARVDEAIRELIRHGEPINFRSVHRQSGASLSFLYGPAVRGRIERLRDQQLRAAAPEPVSAPEHHSSVVRTLTHQNAELKARHQRETTELRQALAAAHGEILSLRRQLGARRSDA